MIIKAGCIDASGKNTSFRYIDAGKVLEIYPAKDQTAKIKKSGKGKGFDLYRLFDLAWVKMQIEFNWTFKIEKMKDEEFVNYVTYTDSSGSPKSIIVSEHLLFIMNDDGKTIDRY